MLTKPQKNLIAILFAAGEPIEIRRIAQAMDCTEETIARLALLTRDFFDNAGMPLELLRLGDKLQLATQSRYADIIRLALDIKRNIPLSQAAMEVLAIIAYNQPVTKSFIEQIRGVDSGGVVNSLVEKSLIEETGRLEIPGRPISYATTPNFLRCFGLSSLKELPTLPNAQESEPPPGVLEGQVVFAEM